IGDWLSLRLDELPTSVEFSPYEIDFSLYAARGSDGHRNTLSDGTSPRLRSTRKQRLMLVSESSCVISARFQPLLSFWYIVCPSAIWRRLEAQAMMLALSRAF